MPLWIQHLLALALVALCAAALVGQVVRSFRGSGKLGRCCAKGCGAVATSGRPAGQRIVFIPSDALRRRR